MIKKGSLAGVSRWCLQGKQSWELRITALSDYPLDTVRLKAAVTLPMTQMLKRPWIKPQRPLPPNPIILH